MAKAKEYGLPGADQFEQNLQDGAKKIADKPEFEEKADELADAAEEKTPDAEKDGAKWASKNDDRVTRIGHFIRKYRVDELPQLLNVFKGEMAFIGPRPERPQFVEQLVREVPYYNQRHNVKPGLAGWAQLNYPYGASVEDSMEKLKFDLYYVKHQSLLLDILILIRTVEIVLFGKGR